MAQIPLIPPGTGALTNPPYPAYQPMPTPGFTSGTADPNWPYGNVYVPEQYPSSTTYLGAICFYATYPLSDPNGPLSIYSEFQVIAYTAQWAVYIATQGPGGVQPYGYNPFDYYSYILYQINLASYTAYATYYNPTVAGLVTTYNNAATGLNNNPAVQDPQGYAFSQVAYYQGVVNTQVATINAIIAAQQAYALATIASTQTTVNQTAAPYIATANTQIAAAMVTVNNAKAQADAAIVTYSALANAQITALQNTINQQTGPLQSQVAAQQAAAMIIINGAIVTATTTVSNAVAPALAQASAALAQVYLTLASLTALLVDLPLVYGQLATPIVVTSVNDVVTIPAGGLIVTAD